MSEQTTASPVPFALLSNGRLVDISSFESGVLTDGKCPECGGALVAKKGAKRAHHFAHYSVTGCAGALETSLHLAAKQVLIDAVAEGRSFFAPAFGYSYSEKRKYPAIDLPLLSVECEKNVFLPGQHRRPDAIAEWAHGALAIEICVTNPVDDDRQHFYEIKRLDCVEIDLGSFKEKFQKTKKLILDDVAEAVLRGHDLKTWVCRADWVNALIQQEPELLSEPSVSQKPLTPPNQSFLEVEVINISGKSVKLRRLPSGDLSIQVDKNESNLRSMIESMARANGSGWYDYGHQNWLVPRRNANNARNNLIALSQRKS